MFPRWRRRVNTIIIILLTMTEFDYRTSEVIIYIIHVYIYTEEPHWPPAMSNLESKRVKKKTIVTRWRWWV